MYIERDGMFFDGGNGFRLAKGYGIEQLVAEVRANLRGGELAKANSVTVETGLINYDLQRPAKNLYPVNTPIRNRLPRVAGDGDKATHWKSVYAIGSSGYAGSPYVSQGNRAGLMTVSAADQMATYSTIGQEINLTYEAWSAAQGFEDEKARNAIRVLQQMMLSEETVLVGGNYNYPVAAPSAPTAAGANTGGTIGAGTYLVAAVSLTYEGYRNWIASGASIVTGIPTQKTVTDPVGGTSVINGGTSNKSSNSSGVVISGTGVITASVDPVNGAVAYAWFVGTSGNQKLEAVTLLPSLSLTALAGTGQAASAITADHSYNDNTLSGCTVSGVAGLLYAAYKSSTLSSPSAEYLPGAYVKHLNTVLHASGRGTVTEIDDMLESMWNNYQVSPTVIYVNAAQLKDITTLCLDNSSGPLLAYFTDPKTGYAGMVAGGVVGWYYNPFAMNGGVKIPVMIHPTLTPGVIFCWCEDLPVQYQSPEVPNVAEVHCRRDYYEIDWPPRTRLYEMGVYSEETLAVYAAFAVGVIDTIVPL